MHAPSPGHITKPLTARAGIPARLMLSCLTAVAAIGGAAAADGEAIRIPRGRAAVNAEHTTLVADNGERLRGACFVANIEGLKKLKELGQNTVHHYAETFDMNYPAPGSRGPGYNVAEMDRFVAMTRDLGLYFVFTIGGEAKFHHQWAVDFWKFYAPRYAHETHVIYEIHNEPVGWAPPYHSPRANPPGAVEMNVDAYKAIRAAAPDTPVLIFTYSQVHGRDGGHGHGGGKDALADIEAFVKGVGGDPQKIWSNTAVAFHGYAGHQATAEGFRTILAGGYPVMNTEFYTTTWAGNPRLGQQDIELTGWMEEAGVSWISFLYTPPAPWGLDVTSPERFKLPIEHAGISWKPDFGTWPAPRSPFADRGVPKDVGTWENGKLSGKLHQEFEEFDKGGEGVAYHDLTPGTNEGKAFRPSEGVDIFSDAKHGGNAFVRADEGEWMEYTFQIREPGDYDLVLRHANATPGAIIRLSLAGSEIIQVPLKGAGTADAWTTQSQSVFLRYGRAVLRMEMAKGRADLDWFELVPVAEGLIPSSVRKIINQSSGLVLSNSKPDSSHVVQAVFTGEKSQLWEFKHLGGGQYRITSQENGRLWSPVWFWNSNIDLATGGNERPDSSQRFLLRSAGGGYYRLAPAASGYDIILTSSHEGAALSQGGFGYSGEPTRHWAILPPKAITPPCRLTAERNNAGAVVLNWRAVPGATAYMVKRAQKSGGPYTASRVPGKDTSYTDHSAPKEGRGYYVVSAVDASGESPDSSEATPGMLHASYAFDTEGTTIVDGVRGAWNGDTVGSPKYGPGVAGKALVLDGAGDYATLPAGIVSELTECSITAWIRIDGAAKWARLIDFGNDKDTNMFIAPINADGQMHFAIKQGGVEHSVSGKKPVPTGRWVHVAAVLQGGGGRIYLDGEEIGSSSGWTLTPQALGKTTHNFIGKSQYPDPLLKGAVDDLRIYSTGLSQADIERMAGAQPAGTGR